MIRRCIPHLADLALIALFVAPDHTADTPATTAASPAGRKAANDLRQAALPGLSSTGNRSPRIRCSPEPARDTWDRKIRERGYILTADDGTYDLWYTGYAGDHPPRMSLGHATSLDGIHWTRDASNPIFTDSWVEDMCVAAPRRYFSDGRRGKKRCRPPLEIDGRPQLDRSRASRYPQTRREADRARAVRHPNRSGSRMKRGTSFTNGAIRVSGWPSRKT